MSLERYSHLYDLMHRGNTAFRENRFDQVDLSAVLYFIEIFSLTWYTVCLVFLREGVPLDGSYWLMVY